jgi:hypothetical protein
VLVFSSAMAQYADAYPQARRVVDFCDVDSDKWRQYADKKSFPMSWLYRYEANQLLRYERQVARDYDASLFVSAPEAALFRQLAPESTPRSATSTTASTPITFRPSRARQPVRGGRARAGVHRRDGLLAQRRRRPVVCDDVFPALRARFPDLRFYIVGARPSPAVQALASRPAWW